MFKYSVIQYIFGGYDNIKEILRKQDDVDYILVTDDPNLKSDTWRIVYDEKFASLPIYEKFYYVRFNQFNYCTTDICVYIDGSIQIKDSLDKLVEDFDKSGAILGVMSHPYISNLLVELNFWIQKRNYSVENANNFIKTISKTHYDFNYKSYFQMACSIRRNVKKVRDIDHLIYQFIINASTEDRHDRHDQTWTAYVLNTWYNDINLFLMDPQIVESYAMQRYEHGTMQKASLAGTYDINIPRQAWCFNQLRQTYYLKK